MGERVVCVWHTVGAGCAVQARRQRLTVSPSQNPSQKSDGSRQKQSNQEDCYLKISLLSIHRAIIN